MMNILTYYTQWLLEDVIMNTVTVDYPICMYMYVLVEHMEREEGNTWVRQICVHVQLSDDFYPT